MEGKIETSNTSLQEQAKLERGKVSTPWQAGAAVVWKIQRTSKTIYMILNGR
jgi:hypothetical protein